MSDYLMHYGRSKLDGAPSGSGRYPLGSGENPRAERKGIVQRFFGRKNQNQANKQDEEPMEPADKRKARIISTGDLAGAYKHRADFTNQELEAVIARHNVETRVKNLITPQNVNTGAMTADKFKNNLATAASLVENGTKLYNGTARIINVAFNKKLPIIQTGKDDKNQNQNQNQNQDQNQTQKIGFLPSGDPITVSDNDWSSMLRESRNGASREDARAFYEYNRNRFGW